MGLNTTSSSWTSCDTETKSNSYLGAGHVLGLVDEFEHSGPYGNHVCLVSKPMGPDMTKYRRLFPKARIPLATMKTIARQPLLALDFLHDICGIVHCGRWSLVLPVNAVSSLTAAADINRRISSSRPQQSTECLRMLPLRSSRHSYLR